MCHTTDFLKRNFEMTFFARTFRNTFERHFLTLFKITPHTTCDDNVNACLSIKYANTVNSPSFFTIARTFHLHSQIIYKSSWFNRKKGRSSNEKNLLNSFESTLVGRFFLRYTYFKTKVLGIFWGYLFSKSKSKQKVYQFTYTFKIYFLYYGNYIWVYSVNRYFITPTSGNLR